MNTKKFDIEPVRVTFLIEKTMRKQYKEYCLTNDIVMSDRIRLLIEKDLKGEISLWLLIVKLVSNVQLKNQ